LEEKITTCTLLAEEQDDFIQNQLETIQKLKSKIEDLQNNLKKAENYNKEVRILFEFQMNK
jgi:anion-transporting  ArsA/GET3 family ATPase